MWCLTTGCAGDNRLAEDPLLGRPAPVAPPVPGGATSPAQPLAAVPAPNPSGSNAALAAATPRPLDGGTDLHIAAPRPAGSVSWVGQPSVGNPPAAPTAVASAPATSGAPVPNPKVSPFDPGYKTEPPQAPIYSLAGAIRTSTFEQAQAQLAARGVAWQRLETVGDKGNWKFTCSVPNPQNRAISRTYEATAGTPHAALQAVLDQIGKEK
jgi:hypothetical protein